jgi:hypothetical protein
LARLVLKASGKSGCGIWVVGLVGAIGIWDGLVHLATRKDPIFGEWNHHEPGWVALDILLGICFLILAISFAVSNFKKDDSDKEG